MLTELESNELMNKLVDLRDRVKESKDKELLEEFKRHENICIEKFKYLITMRSSRYKNFNNYEDLKQEGFEALIKAMKTYNPSLGNFFGWAHKYIGTRIARHANLYTAIRYPMRVAKLAPPHKESKMPIVIEERYCPDKDLENSQVVSVVHDAMTYLSDKQKEIISMAYGFDGGKPVSINKICRKMKITRLSCIKTINSALSLMKENIKI
jgi:RNA polymerase sigma factor (sigma-70 family)